MNKALNLGMIALVGLTFACGGGETTTETVVEAVAEAPVKEMSLEEKYQNDPITSKELKN